MIKVCPHRCLNMYRWTSLQWWRTREHLISCDPSLELISLFTPMHYLYNIEVLGGVTTTLRVVGFFCIVGAGENLENTMAAFKQWVETSVILTQLLVCFLYVCMKHNWCLCMWLWRVCMCHLSLVVFNLWPLLVMFVCLYQFTQPCCYCMSVWFIYEKLTALWFYWMCVIYI